MTEAMDPRVAQALSDLVGPLMAEGMALGMAESVAKLRAFNAGTYEGEPCEHCGVKVALLDPWRRVGGVKVIRLCHDCGVGAGMSMDREAQTVRELPQVESTEEELFCSKCKFHKPRLFGGMCWECAHIFLREQAGHNNAEGYADSSFRRSKFLRLPR